MRYECGQINVVLLFVEIALIEEGDLNIMVNFAAEDEKKKKKPRVIRVTAMLQIKITVQFEGLKPLKLLRELNRGNQWHYE